MRVYALVEGKTERVFVETVVSPHLAQRGIALNAIQLMTSRDHRGGMTSFARVERQLENLMKGHAGGTVRFTTLFDLYALPSEFPGFSPSVGDPYLRIRRIETAIFNHFGDRRLIPHKR